MNPKDVANYFDENKDEYYKHLHYRHAVERHLAKTYNDLFIDSLISDFYKAAIDTWHYVLNPEHLAEELLSMYELKKKTK